MSHNYDIFSSNSSAVARNAVFAVITTLAINVILLLVIYYLRQTDVKMVKQYDLKEINLTNIKKEPLNPVIPKEPLKPKKIIKPKPKLLKQKLITTPPPMSPISMKPLSRNLNMNLLPVNSLSAITVSVEPGDENQITDSSEAETNLFDVSRVDQRPVPVSRSEPVYPLSAKKSGMEGWVEVAFIVDENGSVINADIINSSSRRFHQSALRTIYKWRFKPGIKDQQAVLTRCRQKFTFELN